VNKEIRKEYLENYVLDELHTKLFSESSIKKLSVMLNDYNRRKTEESSGEAKLASDELAGIHEKIGRVVQLVSESGISIETVKDELKRLEERKQFVEGYLKETRLTNNVSLISEDTIYDLINRSKDFIRTHNIAECANFIQSYIEKVVVFGDRVEVFFKIHVLNDTTNSVTPLRSEADINALKRGYRRAG
jgi:site-specific DNA recombinase